MKFKNSKVLGTTILLASGLICKILGALFRLPLTNLLGIEGIGIFQLIMSLYSFALVLTCGGITNSLAKLISTARAQGKFKKISTYLKRAFLISISVAIFIGLIFVLFGKYISLFQGIGQNDSYFLFVLLLPLGAGLSTFRGFFQGHENMLPTAISQVLEQVFRFCLGLLFAFYFGKFGTAQGVFGAFLGITLSEVISIIYLFFLWISKSKRHQKLSDLQQIHFAHKEFDKANFSLTISASILPLVNAFDGLFIVQRLTQAGFTNNFATKLFGLQTGVVGALLNFPLIISIAVTTTLLPNISYLISRGAGGKSVIEKGLKTLLFLILPTTFGVVAISKPLLALVYTNLSGQLLNTAYELMFYGGFSIIFTALMQYLIMLLQANGQFKFIMLITLVGGIFKATTSFLLSALPNINIFALVLGNIFLSATICIFALVKLKQLINFSLSFQELFTLIFSTLSMFIVVHSFVNGNYFHPLPNIILAIALGILVYAVFSLPFLLKISNRYRKKV